MKTDDAGLLRRRSESIVPHGWSRFPPDLLQKARRRVLFIAWLSFGAAVLGSLLAVGNVLFVLRQPDPTWIGAGTIPIALAAGLLFAAVSERLDDLALLRIALVYEILFCLFAAIIGTWLPFRLSGQIVTLTWVTPIIILFPLVVPSPPSITLTVSILAASTRPLALVLLHTYAGANVDVTTFVMSTFSPAVAVVMAYTASRAVHGITVDLAHARRLGSYELLSRLGVGGMGEVWRAEHQMLARPSAIKLIKPQSMTQDFAQQQVVLRRFEREARTTAAMQSPHTIDVYDFGIAQSGAFYYVMELLRGLDMEELVDRFGPLPPARLVYLLEQMCDSLGEAHEHGLIHRDVKPANVYVCRFNRQVDFVKILDFGLVRQTQNVGAEATRLTIDGAAVGTPGFVAPEQVLGQTIDGRTDIYSLGCTAYWALTGEYVFQAETGMGTMMMHVNTPPEPPSLIGAQTIPPDLEDLILWCLEKDPSNRPRNVDEVAKALAICDVGERWSQGPAHLWWESNLITSGRPESRWTAAGE